MKIEPVILDGQHVRLEPLSAAHSEGIRGAITDGELWKLAVTMVPYPDMVDEFILDAVKIQESGEGLAFATIDNKTGEIAGSTRYMHTNHTHKRTEIGFTFIGRSWQRTRLNTEAKLLMLTHAFEVLRMNRVEFLTDVLNHVSRTAIKRLGAIEEGIMRNHMIMREDRVRDSIVFSIIRPKWADTKKRLEQMLAA